MFNGCLLDIYGYSIMDMNTLNTLNRYLADIVFCVGGNNLFILKSIYT